MKKAVRIVVLILADAVVFNLSYLLSFMLRFEFDWQDPVFQTFFPAYAHNFIFLTIIKLAIFFAIGMYRSLWDYAGPDELMKIVLASFLSALAALAFLLMIQQTPPMPRSIYVLSFIFDTVLAGSLRFGYRYARAIKNKQGFRSFLGQFRGGSEKGMSHYMSRVMLVGAGEAGSTIIREIKANPRQNTKVVVAVDDNPAKKGQMLNGVKIAGSKSDIQRLVKEYRIDKIIVAIPSASRRMIKEIMDEAGKTGAKVQILPAMIDLIGGTVSVSALRDVNIEDLLGREPVELDTGSISNYLEGRVVMVTGGGGSIGAELCRQISRHKPKRLIALDNYENAVFELDNELKATTPDLSMDVVIASVRDKTRLQNIFEIYKPQVIFHAAAHKHVPLMESNPGEAIVNNILGTKNVVDLADKYGVEKFVMISTDKAVNPSNVMGASKRLAEMVVQEKSKDSGTAFAVVRFGNVLGSNGSVIPVFRKQIEAGGPITVTHPDITRYFMTIPEAVQLVMQAGAMTKGGEIFILDMGEPVKILDLAENMIRLSGLEPYEDIEIKITSLRPGEKLHEELSYESEDLDKTEHDKIYLGKAQDASPKLSEILSGNKNESNNVDSGNIEYDETIESDINKSNIKNKSDKDKDGKNKDEFETIIKAVAAETDDSEVRKWLHEFLPTYKRIDGPQGLKGIRNIDD